MAEKALTLWHGHHIIGFAVDTPELREVILPLIFPALYVNSVGHWHDSVQTLSHHILTVYCEAVRGWVRTHDVPWCDVCVCIYLSQDPVLYQRCLVKVEAELGDEGIESEVDSSKVTTV